LVCLGKIAALFGGLGGGKISGNRPHHEKKEDERNKIRHRGPKLMLAARSKLL
jgi:hypothetical protein